jgi:hypothetical protein
LDARRLSPLHFNCLLFIISFVKELVRFESANLLSAEVAAKVFSRVLMRKFPHEDAAMYADPSLPRHMGTVDLGIVTEVEQGAMDAFILHFLRMPKLE